MCTLIRHVVFFSAKNKADLPAIMDGLARLGKIPAVDVFEVHENANLDSISREVDVVVYAEFANSEALRSYKAHPLYKEAVDIVRPLRDLRVVADF